MPLIAVVRARRHAGHREQLVAYDPAKHRRRASRSPVNLVFDRLENGEAASDCRATVGMDVDRDDGMWRC